MVGAVIYIAMAPMAFVSRLYFSTIILFLLPNTQSLPCLPTPFYLLWAVFCFSFSSMTPKLFLDYGMFVIDPAFLDVFDLK